MNAKHYVSLEVAKMLKEKWYNEATTLYYNTLGELKIISQTFSRALANNFILSSYGYISAPSLLDAKDWLEERDIFISVEYFGANEWKYFIFSTKHLKDNYETDDVFYTDSNECMNAAIKKGVEFL